MDSLPWVRDELYSILIASKADQLLPFQRPCYLAGVRLGPKLVIVALVIFLPVVVNVLDGLHSVDRDMLNLVWSMGGSWLGIFRHIKLPVIYTPLFSALKLSATYQHDRHSDRRMDTASTSGGLGTYLLQANSRLNTAGTFAAIAFLVLRGAVSSLIMLALKHPSDDALAP